MTIHIYRANDQPATRHVLWLDDDTKIVIRHKPRCLLPCFKCRRKRIARNLVAHVYYDGTYLFCKPGKGCKS